MSHSSVPPEKLPRGTVAVPAASIGVMSLILAVGFQSLGLIDRIDRALLEGAKNAGLGSTVVPVSPWVGWIIAVVVAFGLPLAILEIPTHWRRTLVLLGAVTVVAGLWPVLALAAHWWPLAPSLVTVLWSGLCAKIYASRHHMPCEGGNAGRRARHGRNR